MLMANDYPSSNSSSHSKTRAYLKSLRRPLLSFATEPAFAPAGSLLTSSPSSSPISYTSPYITWPQTASIFRTTHNPETSKLFVSYLLSSQHQRSMNTSGFATRRSFDTKGVFKQMPLMDGRGYQKFMLDRQNVEEWRFQFEKILGLPKGGNPNGIDF
jgi:ABC-type Fe3+ transport system substrate-binding protein